MRYRHIVAGRFLERPNRFIARVEIGNMEERHRQKKALPPDREQCQEEETDRIETVHVKNTGRCRELLQRGALVYLEKSDNPERRTAYDLVAVEKGTRLVNMDSQAPNKVVEEWLREGGYFSDISMIQPEFTYGNSRFDFYIETREERIFMEVKGVTLEENGVVQFPDAPSERAVKHVEELIQARHAGYRCFVMFVIQMQGVKYFTPNKDTHPEFAEVLCRAREEGVELLAYDCLVTPETLEVNRPVPIILHETLRKNLEKSKRKDISIPLLKWYDSDKRILPWRENPTPYRVWVSEIMLQQTRVQAVMPYFERFMKALPDIGALADVEEETLLKLWEGLGYYNRARNLQKAAVQIQMVYGGEMPDNYEQLLELAGIGSYTAGAIASIAFQRPVPAVDGNVLRVLSRLRMDERPITDSKVKESVEQALKEVIPKDRPGDFNQAMMEIGACVCIPNGAPLCDSCPLREFCLAHMTGTEQEYPKRQAKKPRQIENRTILLIQDDRRTVLQKRPDRGLLAGMYEFPAMEGFRTAEEVEYYLADKGLKPLEIQALEDAKHIFTHREWHMKGYRVRVDSLEKRETEIRETEREIRQDWIYIEPEEAGNKYPIPSAFGAYKKYLESGRK